MRIALTILMITMMSLPVGAQKEDKPTPEKKVGFNSIRLNKVGKFEANIKIKNTLQAWRNGVDITIKGETPEEDINILADTILFSYASKEDSQPSAMKLSGKIHIKSNAFTIECNKATINIGIQEAHFEEVKRIKTPDFAPMKADEVNYNFETGKLTGINLESIDTEPESKTTPEAP